MVYHISNSQVKGRTKEAGIFFFGQILQFGQQYLSDHALRVIFHNLSSLPQRRLLASISFVLRHASGSFITTTQVEWKM